jgi:choline-sulfatase
MKSSRLGLVDSIQSRKRFGMVIVATLGLSGLSLLGMGLGWFASPAVPETSTWPAVAGPTANQPLGIVRPGAGVFTSDGPQVAEATAKSAACEGCDVVLITVCSLRKDHLGTYGFSKDISPSIDALADTAVRFNRAYAASNFTLASLTSLLTGRYGSATGVTGWDKGLTVDVPTLATVLSVYGYRTGAFTTDAPSGFRPDYGLDRGFQHMEITPPPRNTPDGRFRGGTKGELGAVALPAVSWLEKQPEDHPMFLMMHTRTAHFPFVVDPPTEGKDPTGMRQLLFDAGQAESKGRAGQAMPGMAGGTAQEGIVEIVRQDPLQTQVNALGKSAMDVWRETYAEGVTRMDADVETLLKAVHKRGRPTVVVLVADHGESLNDHGELLHGDAFFHGVINVPLIISVPGLKGALGERNALVSQTDVLPTILDLVGAVSPAGVDGTSLVELLKGSDEEVHGLVLSEGGVAKQEGDALPGAVIAPPWMLIKQRRGCGGSAPMSRGVSDQGMPVCLFNLEKDPGLNNSVSGSHPQEVQDLLERWNGFRKAHGRLGERRELSDAFIEELQRSGYDFSTGAP